MPAGPTGRPASDGENPHAVAVSPRQQEAPRIIHPGDENNMHKTLLAQGVALSALGAALAVPSVAQA
ncbi:hypothetical protein E0E53_15795, partial [Azotobacter chroococcum]